MPIQYVSGDIFVNRYNAQALAHGCNCKGAMGAGVAKGFRQNYPDMYEEYRRRCKAQPRQFNPGDSLLWKTDDKLSIFNLGTQEDYWHHRATYDAIEKSLETMKHQAEEESIHSIAIPCIGAGYGGLSWKKVRPIIERVFKDWPGTLYLYEEFLPGE
jgi:O-acetyl-ADP-ribose deacetylase (regulator of RNase III)